MRGGIVEFQSTDFASPSLEPAGCVYKTVDVQFMNDFAMNCAAAMTAVKNDPTLMSCSIAQANIEWSKSVSPGSKKRTFEWLSSAEGQICHDLFLGTRGVTLTRNAF